MNDKENSNREAVAHARRKRKFCLRERNADKYKQICSSNQRTPLCDVTQYKRCSSDNNTEFPQNQFTQPSSNLDHALQSKRTRTGMQYNGQNLINRFDAVILNQPRLNPSCNNTDRIQTKKNVETGCTNPQSSSQIGSNNNHSPENCYSFAETEDFSSDSDSSFVNDDFIHGNAASSTSNVHQGYYDIGDPIHQCNYCKALMWYQERMGKHKHAITPKYYLCCGNGKVQLPLLKEPPSLLKHLLFDQNSDDSKHFQHNIRVYNAMFAFTSPGIKLDPHIYKSRGPPTIRFQGESCHRIGSLLPLPKQSPKFAQLYIYDTENEVQNRIRSMSKQPNVDPEIVKKLSNMLDKYNTHAQCFRQARDKLKQESAHNLKLQLIFDRSTDGRIYNIPNVSDIAAVIVGDVNSASHRDIIVERQCGKLQRIDELHPSYLGFQYPLLFPYGEDGYRSDVLHRDSHITQDTKRNRLTIREWLCFRLQTRMNEAHTLIRSRRLFQQFLVDSYMMLESERLSFIRYNQCKLRVDKYSNLADVDSNNQNQGSDKGKRVILPSSFVGGRRYMDQLYFDAMTICSHVGFPDLFITFTCNPYWKEIQRLLAPLNLKPVDRPDIVARVFKIKFQELLTDLTKKHVLGKVIACRMNVGHSISSSSH